MFKRLFDAIVHVLSLPEDDPRRWIAAQVVLYLGAGILILAITIARISM